MEKGQFPTYKLVPVFKVVEVGRVSLTDNTVQISPVFKITASSVVLVKPWGAVMQKNEDGIPVAKRYFTIVQSTTWPLITFKVGGDPEEVEEILLEETFSALLRVEGAPITVVRLNDLLKRAKDEIVDEAVRFLNLVSNKEEIPPKKVKIKFPSPAVIGFPMDLKGKREGYIVYDGFFDKALFETEIRAVARLPWHVWAEANFKKYGGDYVTEIREGNVRIWSERPFPLPLVIEDEEKEKKLYVACFMRDTRLHADDGKKKVDFLVLGTIGFSL